MRLSAQFGPLFFLLQREKVVRFCRLLLTCLVAVDSRLETDFTEGMDRACSLFHRCGDWITTLPWEKKQRSKRI